MTLTYVPPGLKTGALISAVTLLVLLASLSAARVRRRRLPSS